VKFNNIHRINVMSKFYISLKKKKVLKIQIHEFAE